ncbi:MAG: hypothetical protein COB15_15080 [Flavobacteriales bacterium]|nr:MAG: hypothetical protein COB15_15080 [Flavobacteriales bacterium]
MKKLLLLVVLFPFFTSAQVVEELIQIDTTSETIKVIYKPKTTSSYYFKKIAVFADDTSQIAIEKSYTSYGQNGIYKVYYPSGRLKIKTVFANNKVHGEWTYYGLDGIIITKGIYKEGVKHGYWAYKSLRIYGRYKKGLKNKKWKRFDESENKYISHYKKGVLTSGEGVGDEVPTYLSKPKQPKSVDTNTIVEVDTNKISKEYEQTIAFLTNNVLFRKALKKHFGTSMKNSLAIKKLFDKERFQFAISPEITALSISTFIKESEEGKIVVANIDSLLKNEKVNIQQEFSGKKIEENQTLKNNSTDLESPMKIAFSEVKFNLLRLDVIWTFKEEGRKFQVLLYFDEKGKLKGAEYEKS